MAGKTLVRIATWLVIAALLATAFWLDYAVLPQYPIPVLYEVPVLVAALRLRWDGVVLTALGATAAAVLCQMLHPTDAGLWLLYFGGFLAASALCIAIAAHRERYARQVQQLIEAESRFLGVFDAVFDAVVVTHASGYIAQINASAEEFFGYSRQAAVGLPLVMLLTWPAEPGNGAAEAGGAPGSGGTPPRGSARTKRGLVVPAEVRQRALTVDGRVMRVYVVRV